MKIIFIRHGETHGNTEKRYIGKTDEPLCPRGIQLIESRSYPACDIVVTSPMKRCIQTAEIIYPDVKKLICDDLRECDFGDFEGKNYKELNGNTDYQKWIDSGGTLPFPNGESVEDFKNRCTAAFTEMVSTLPCDCTAAFVVHGGTIMAVLEKYAVPQKDYYDYMTENGGYYLTEYDGKNLKIIGE